MTTARRGEAGRSGTDGAGGTATVPDAVAADTQRAAELLRRIEHHRRHVKALDWHLNPPAPWVWAEPVGDLYRDGHLNLTYGERDALGREMAGVCCG